MHKIQATTARAFQKTEMSREYQSNSASVDSATTDENQLPTQNLSASQWNPKLMTLNKYPWLYMEHRTPTFPFLQQRQGALTAPESTEGWGRDTISARFTLTWCCGFTGCFLSEPSIGPHIRFFVTKLFMITCICHADHIFSHTCLISFYPSSIK